MFSSYISKLLEALDEAGAHQERQDEIGPSLSLFSQT